MLKNSIKYHTIENKEIERNRWKSWNYNRQIRSNTITTRILYYHCTLIITCVTCDTTITRIIDEIWWKHRGSFRSIFSVENCLYTFIERYISLPTKKYVCSFVFAKSINCCSRGERKPNKNKKKRIVIFAGALNGIFKIISRACCIVWNIQLGLKQLDVTHTDSAPDVKVFDIRKRNSSRWKNNTKARAFEHLWTNWMKM